jgi:hypothetical protein
MLSLSKHGAGFFSSLSGPDEGRYHDEVIHLAQSNLTRRLGDRSVS